MLHEAWQKEGITPTPAVDDARWLRRVHVDIVGVIPRPEVVNAFASDAAKDKRAKMIETLLASPRYVDFWTAYWDDALMGERARAANIDRNAFRAWLRERIEKNAPYNEFVRDLVSASGRNSEGGSRKGNGEPVMSGTDDAPVNGAVNWFLKFQTPQDLAGTTSRTFLGVQIQCAQCHDHKTEAWKQTDFEKLAASFTRTQVQPLDVGKTMGMIRRVDVVDIGRPLPRYAKDFDTKTIAQAVPTTLDGKEITRPNVRLGLAEWMTARENPWFARATVNRMWAHFLGRGFVDPVDDLRPSNPATLEPLFARLADEFVRSGYDMKSLIRTITGTEAYQLAVGGGTAATTNAEGGKTPHKFWSRFRMTPLGPNELVSSLVQATDLEALVAKDPKINLDNVRAQLSRDFAFLFDVDEEIDRAAFEGTITQALTLLNGSLIGSGSRTLPGGALTAIVDGPGSDAEKIEAMYLRTVSRKPTPEEVGYWTRFVSEVSAGTWTPPALASRPPAARPPGADPLRRLETKGAARKSSGRAEAFEDIFWALLNSSEFVFNH